MHLTLGAAPGETEDQSFIWFDAHRVLFCGDNYYGCWPNLYAIRGGQYRDVAGWIDSLDRMRQYPAEALLPGHTHPIIGRDAVADVLANFRNALDYVLTETLACMDRGMGIEETVDTVKLPDQYGQLPYLGEFYGTVAWSVRGIYTGYLGWFDGNPTNLNPLPPRQRAGKSIELMGGSASVAAAVPTRFTPATLNGRWSWPICCLRSIPSKVRCATPRHAGSWIWLVRRRVPMAGITTLRTPGKCLREPSSAVRPHPPTPSPVEQERGSTSVFPYPLLSQRERVARRAG